MRRPRLGLAGLALVLLTGAACSLISSQVSTDQALRADGFANANVSIGATIGADGTVTATVSPKPGLDGLQAQSSEVASVVWTHFRGRFDRLGVSVNGLGRQDFTHDQLVSTLGPRPSGLDDQSVTSELNSGVAVVGWAVAGFVIVFLVAAVLLVVFLVRRSRRRHPPGYAAWPPGGYPQPWPPQGSWPQPQGQWPPPPGQWPPSPPQGSPPGGPPRVP